MHINRLSEWLKQHDQPKFRLDQIRKAIFHDGLASFADVTVLSKDLRAELESNLPILAFAVSQVLEAKDGQSAKALLELPDGNFIETVLMSPVPGMWSVCVSTQVGCPMGCRFCATGQLGLKRNLTAEEITDQVLFWRQYLKRKFPPVKGRQRLGPDNVVYMGMGEPFLNWEAVSESLRNLTDLELFGIGARNISISTSGIPDGIRQLGREFPQVNLAVSLHFATDEKRDEFMPVNRKDNLAELRKALKDYFADSNRQVFIEYILLKDVNDLPEDARALAGYLKSIGKKQLLHVNLIRYNLTGEEFESSSGNQAEKFKGWLAGNGFEATIRKSLGEEIQGACGQLAGK